MKRRIVLLGAPASGKGTQAEMISARLGIEAVSLGAIFRQQKEEGTPMGKQADEYTRHGQLVPDELAVAMLKPWVGEHKDAFIFDGFPRTIGQAEALESMLDEVKAQLDLVLFLEVTEEIIGDRILKRRVCGKCGLNFSIGLHIQESDQICPRCGGGLIRRKDDTLEILKERMKGYHEKTEPLIDFYKDRGLLKSVDATRHPEEVFKEIMAILEE